jgi:hypothetical protein
MEPVNILTALAENERVMKNANDPERRAIALAWRFLGLARLGFVSDICSVALPQQV